MSRRRGKPRRAPAIDAPRASVAAASTPPSEATRAPTPPAAAPARPAFWFEFAVAPHKLAIARVGLFVIVALDALLGISRAPRYAAGGFNVAHLRVLDSLVPDRITTTVALLVVAYACGLCAAGVATRVAAPIATALYGWVYFSSQLDSYQHHYLIFLLLLLACFVPWEARPAEPPTRGRPGPPRIASWALRVMLVQLAVVYAWAAASKLGPRWLDGTALSRQIHDGLAFDILSTVGFRAAAWGVLLTELVLAATIWHRRGWRVALPVGVGLHAGIALTDLEIGLFAYLMLALYVLVIPEPWIDRLARRLPAWRAPRGAAGLVLLGVGVAVGVALALSTDLPAVTTALVAVLPLSVVAGVWTWRHPGRPWARLGAAHALALGLWWALDAGSSTTIDHYRFWGGAASRLGDPTTGRAAYGHILRLDPLNGNATYQLGKIARSGGSVAEAKRLFARAAELEPHRARAGVALAELLAAEGATAEARAAVEAALRAEPGHAGATRLRAQLAAGGAIRPSDEE